MNKDTSNDYSINLFIRANAGIEHIHFTTPECSRILDILKKTKDSTVG